MSRSFVRRPGASFNFLTACACLGMTAVVEATTFETHPLDLTAGFRQDGASFELVVNLGSISNYTKLDAGKTITIEAYSQEQLENAFPSLENLKWSISGEVSITGHPSYPDATLWLTKPRDAATSQSTPWVRKSESSQRQTGAGVETVPSQAVVYGASIPADPVLNTASAITIPAGSPFSYSIAIGPTGNWGGTFQGNIETTTSESFADPDTSRADFYELRPTVAGEPRNPPATYLGFFEFRPDGKLLFTRAGGSAVVPPPRPVIVSSLRSLKKFTVTFTTTNNPAVQYWLRHTNLAAITVPVSQWTKGTSSVAGTGGTAVLEDASEAADQIYAVEANWSQ